MGKHEGSDQVSGSIGRNCRALGREHYSRKQTHTDHFRIGQLVLLGAAILLKQGHIGHLQVIRLNQAHALVALAQVERILSARMRLHEGLAHKNDSTQVVDDCDHRTEEGNKSMETAKIAKKSEWAASNLEVVRDTVDVPKLHTHETIT